MMCFQMGSRSFEVSHADINKHPGSLLHDLVWTWNQLPHRSLYRWTPQPPWRGLVLMSLHKRCTGEQQTHTEPLCGRNLPSSGST